MKINKLTSERINKCFFKPHIFVLFYKNATSEGMAMCFVSSDFDCAYYLSDFSGFAGVALYSLLSGFFGSALTFFRSLVMLHLKGTTKTTATTTKGNQVARKLSKNLATDQDPIQKDADTPASSRDNLVSLFGLYCFIVGIGVLVVPVVTGSIVDTFASVKVAFLFQSCCHTFCSLALGLALFLSK